MRCISLWQPWATLWVCGLKINETRHWPTSHTGPLAVHAARKWDGKLKAMCYQDPFAAAIEKLRYQLPELVSFDDAIDVLLPRGVVVGTVNLDGCVQIDQRSCDGCLMPERAFGDWTPGRYRWPASRAVRFAEPIPFIGRQQFFEVPDSLLISAAQSAAGTLFAGGGK